MGRVHKIAAAARSPAAALQGLQMGTLVALRDGRPVVQFASAPAEGVVARTLNTAWLGGNEPRVPCAALLFFEDDDPARPVVVGLVQETLLPAALAPQAGTRTLVIDMDRVVLQGHDEVQLRCGEGSITLRSDGKVVVKGTELTSKASATNKIRGASVQIN